MTQYILLKCASYIPLPKKLSSKKAMINIKNSENKLFYVLSPRISPRCCTEKTCRTTSPQFQDEVNFDGIEFPVTIDKVGKFKQQNNIQLTYFASKQYSSQSTSQKYALTPMLICCCIPKGPLNNTVSSNICLNYCKPIIFKRLGCFNVAIFCMGLSEKIFYEITHHTIVNIVHTASNSRTKATPRFSSKITTSN